MYSICVFLYIFFHLTFIITFIAIKVLSLYELVDLSEFDDPYQFVRIIMYISPVHLIISCVLAYVVTKKIFYAPKKA